MSTDVHPALYKPDAAWPTLGTALQWYAVRTKSRHEKQVRDRLFAVGIEPFLPLTRQQRQWSDRRAQVEMPLFAGYCFARFALSNRLTIMQTPGVAGIVGTLRPEHIPDSEIESIRSVCASTGVIERADYFAEGTPVEVVSGPFQGLRGQFVRNAGRNYVVLRIHLIRQAAAVHIHADDVMPLH